MTVPMPKADIHGNLLSLGGMLQGNVDINPPQVNILNVDIYGPKIDAGLNIRGPKVDAGLGLLGVAWVGFGVHVQGPKIDANVPLPSLGALLDSNISATAPQINLPNIESKADINLSKPTIDIPAVDVHGTIEKEIIPPSEGFIPKTEIKGIDLDVEPSKIKVK